MTGSLEHMISISLVSVVAYVVAYLCKSEPIYSSLLEGILEKQGTKLADPSDETMLITYNVTFDSEVDNKKLNEIEWPHNCLVVAIESCLLYTSYFRSGSNPTAGKLIMKQLKLIIKYWKIRKKERLR